MYQNSYTLLITNLVNSVKLFCASLTTVIKDNMKVFLFYRSISHSVLDNEYFFVDSDLRINQSGPRGMEERTKEKSKASVNFTLFSIKFFMDDVSLIQWVHKSFSVFFWPLVFWPLSLLILNYLLLTNDGLLCHKEIFLSRIVYSFLMLNHKPSWQLNLYAN